jgi:hypothetical protein
VRTADKELAAIEELGRRGARLSVYIATPLIVLAVALGVVLTLIIELELEKQGFEWPFAAGLLGFLPPLGASIAIARRVSRAAVRARRSAWIDEVASREALSRRTIEEAFTDWNQ